MGNLVTLGQRFESGLLAAVRRGDERTTWHVLGHTTDALRELARRCDAAGWKVQAISTPETILRDLQGSRGSTAHGEERRLFGSAAIENQVMYPELSILGKIGRVDLFERPGHAA